MQIVFRKVTDERHELAISRAPGSWETLLCETRSYITHDLLHYAVEGEAGVDTGFWGRLAAGASLAEMNDRTRPMGDEMASIERVVGALTSIVKGRSASEVTRAIDEFAASCGVTLPPWLDESFVVAVNERMRQLLGRWKATPRGSRLALEWPLHASAKPV